MKAVATLEQFYEFEEKLVHLINSKLQVSHRELNKKVDMNQLQRILKQKGYNEPNTMQFSVDESTGLSSNENTTRLDVQPKGLLSKRKVDLCGSCERPVLTTEANDDTMISKRINNKRVFVSCNLNNNLMNQTMDLGIKQVDKMPEKIPLYESHDDKMKLKVTKKPKGIGNNNHSLRNSFNDNDKDIASEKSNINTALVTPDFDNNKLPNIKNIFFVDKIKNGDANTK